MLNEISKYSTLFKLIDLDQVSEYEQLREDEYVGFANFYLAQYYDESNSKDEVDIDVFTQLVALDSKLGTTASEQLSECLRNTSRSDIIKV